MYELSLKMLFQFVSVSPAAHILEIARSLFNFEIYFLQYCLHQEFFLCYRIHEKVPEDTLRNLNFFYLNRFLDEGFLLMFQPAAHSYWGKNS